MKFKSKLLALLIFLVIIILIGSFYFLNSKQVKQSSNQTLETTANSEDVDYKASFAIYTNGTFRIFTAPMYHNLSSEVFIEASNPNIVNIKKANLTWGEFFRTLPFELTNDCLTTGTKQTFCSNQTFKLQFYLNGEKNQSVLDQVINPGDKLLVTYNKEGSNSINQQLQSVPNSE